MARKFPRGFQRNRITLTLSNAELDILENIFLFRNTPLSEHILDEIKKARRKQ